MRRIAWAAAAAILFAGNAEAGPCADALAARIAPLSTQTLAKLSKLPAKGETETTVEFRTRLATLVPDRFAVSFPVNTLAEYNADQAALHLPPSAVILPDVMMRGTDYSSYYEGVTLTSSRRTTGRYVGQNAFGATASVDRERLNEFALVWPDDHVSTVEPTEELVIPVQRDQLAGFRKLLSVLILADLVDPLLYASEDFSGATIDAPTDLMIQKRALVSRPICSAVYNRATGQIYGEWALHQH